MPVELKYVALSPLRVQEKDANGEPIFDEKGERVITLYQPGDVVPAENWGSAANHMVEYRRIALVAFNHEEPYAGAREDHVYVVGDDDEDVFPKHEGAGYYLLSDGSRLRGKQAAEEAEALLGLGGDAA